MSMPRRFSVALRQIAMAAIALFALAGCTDAVPAERPQPELPPFSIHDRAETRTEVLALLHEPAHITVHGSTIRWTGVINQENAGALLREARKARERIDTLVINSLGGQTVAGKLLGDWVHDNGITVVVHDVCFSSCANYVFTAAPSKIIRAGAIVAWHGSEQQDRFIAEARGVSIEQYADQVVEERIDDLEIERGRAFSEDERDALRDDSWSVAMRVFVVRGDDGSEQRFLDRIGVRVDALVYGLMRGQYERYRESEAAGWTFRIGDMAAFGIGDVAYEGEAEYPSAAAMERYRVLLLALD